jgi:ABC-type polysaccharide/polyol phosphate transport system ATPase subunit
MISQPAIRLEDVTIRFRLSYDRSWRLQDLVRELGRRTMRRWKPKPFEALRDVSLTVNHGEIVGVIGPNGSGKSTLLRTVSGIYYPDRGSVWVDGRVSALLELGTGFDQNLNGVDNVRLAGLILGYPPEVIEERIPIILDFAEIGEFVNVPLKYYSSGMIARISFALVVSMEPDILLIDETLSVGDLRFKEKSGRAMRDLMARARSQMVVSHDLATIQSMCNRAIFVLGGRIVADGDPADVVREYERAMRSGVESSPDASRLITYERSTEDEAGD